jgi:predicted S18 family serine protease
MPQQVILKKSSVTSKIPTIGDLEFGELAINYADGRLYYKDSTVAIKYFINSDQIAAAYQPTLVSGSNIKTVNGLSLVGSGDITVGGASISDAMAVAIALG